MAIYPHELMAVIADKVAFCSDESGKTIRHHLALWTAKRDALAHDLPSAW
jgi:hypothetical protein